MNFRRSRKGSPADRGKLVEWPQPTAAAETYPRGFWHTLHRLGPGMVTGAADVDPSLIITATVAGAAFAYSLLWLVLLCIPFLVTVFAVSGRLGYQTRRGLVDLVRENYGHKLAMSLAGIIVAINMAMIVADLMAVSDGFSIILGQPRLFFVAATAFSLWYVLIFRDYRRITRALLWLSLPLFVYVAAAVIAAPSPSAVLIGTLIPRVRPSAEYAAAIVGLMGSLLTPYVLVWQTSSRRDQAVSGGEAPHEAEGHAGTFVTTLLAYCVIVASASMLHVSHPVDMTTLQAAESLKPAVGSWGAVLFAVGIIGAGMVALPVLVASMCYSIAEAAGWRAGLSEHPWDARSFYVLISVALLIATVLNYLPINPVRALYWSQILAGILTVPVLALILVLSNDRRIVRTVNTVWQNFWIGAAIGGLVAAGGLLLWWKL